MAVSTVSIFTIMGMERNGSRAGLLEKAWVVKTPPFGWSSVSRKLAGLVLLFILTIAGILG